MSDLSNIKNLSLDRLIAKIGGKSYAVTSLTLRMSIGSPASCELVLAQGQSIRSGRSASGTSSGSYLDKSGISSFTPVEVFMKINGQATALVVFRGIISSISNIAAKNVAGSYAGSVLNCIGAQALMSAFNFTSYRYWSSKADSHKRGARDDQKNRAKLQVIKTADLTTAYNRIGGDGSGGGYISARSDFATYVHRITAVFVEVASGERYSQKSVNVHFNTRGRVLKASHDLDAVGKKEDGALLRMVRNNIIKMDPLSVIRGILNGQMFLNLVPLMNGTMDIMPAFPWSREAVGTIRRADILGIRDSTSLSPAVDNIDSVLVPVPFDDLGNRYKQWPPDKDTPIAGASKIVNVPEWINPFIDRVEAEPVEADENKTNKATKETNEEIEKKDEEYKKVAELLAKAAFAQIKNSGVTMEVSVPWHRLEFFDALGYLIEIEQPIFDGVQSRENLYGLLTGAALKVQSTPGGSSAAMQLVFANVRDATTHAEFALDAHPLYDIQGGPEAAIKAFLSKKGRTYDRAQQIKLEGGSFDSYLDEAISEAKNKK